MNMHQIQERREARQRKNKTLLIGGAIAGGCLAPFIGLFLLLFAVAITAPPGHFDRDRTSTPTETDSGSWFSDDEDDVDDGRMTMAKYHQLYDGQSISSVEAILGPGTENSSLTLMGKETVYMSWGSLWSGGTISCTFTDGELTTKAQCGLK